ncbi:MAG: lytic transglycosylase F, partial [Luminiphilus sp.]
MPHSARSLIVMLMFALLVPVGLRGEPLEHPVALVDNARLTGDLDTMIERRFIRVLTVYGPGRYYLDEGAKGMTAEYATRLEKVINEAYATGHLKVVVLVL